MSNKAIELANSLAGDLDVAWQSTRTINDRAKIASEVLGRLYDDYHRRDAQIPICAKSAFENRDWSSSLELSRLRIALFGEYRDAALAWFKCHDLPEGHQEAFWETTYRVHLKRIAGTYQGDIAYAFLSSVRRSVTKDRWRVVDYSYARATGAKRPAKIDRPDITRELKFAGAVPAEIIVEILNLPGFKASFRDKMGDAEKVAERINSVWQIAEAHEAGVITMIDAGFYRNRGAYLVGILMSCGAKHPFAIALLHAEEGIYVDALIPGTDRLHTLFSSSLANFHATNTNFHELVDRLFEMMPKRPRGLHYSTIGYNHVGKIAVMRQIEREYTASPRQFHYAPGPRGSVAIGFTLPNSGYVLKVVRDRPTEHYKWGHFPGVDIVMAKYRKVHEINRAGGMLDNIIYENASLPYAAFEPMLAKELLDAASENVAKQDDMLVFRHLIAQMRMVPIPQFLRQASNADALEAISSLGRCIKNNAAANVFNRDLDGRNYGVGPTLKVYLFDYDAVEPLTDIKIRTNLDRIDGEEDVPDWFFEDGIVFLPEEIELHLRLEDRAWRQAFRAEHGELLEPEYWRDRQAELLKGHVPRVSTYPNECRLADS